MQEQAWERSQKRKSADRKMQCYLERLQKSGTELYVDGEAVTALQAVKYAVQEGGVYMADYILGEQGRVEQVRFDRIDL